MPTDVQYDMLRSLKGFENAEIMRYAYAIEYDLCDPTEMLPTLEFKTVRGLYGAGQFNGMFSSSKVAEQPPRRATLMPAPTFMVLSKWVL